MNILEKSKADVLDIVFDKLQINVDKAELEAIVWDNAETEVIGDLLLAVNDLLVNLDILTIDELKAINENNKIIPNFFIYYLLSKFLRFI